MVRVMAVGPFKRCRPGAAITSVQPEEHGAPLLPSEGELRSEIRGWLRENWDSRLALVEWRKRLVESGWAVPSWSSRWYGRGLPAWADALVQDELLRIDAVGLPLGGGTALAAPTIYEHGPDLMRERFLLSILTGEENWCQLFSEPGAGSDLAGLTTTAVLDGDHWIVNGQKVWNTSADHADFGILLARTDWDVPKHRGITYFVLPMKQSGVEVRPLRQMNGHASFFEVFLTDARIPKQNVIGSLNEGWTTALTTLAFERRYRVVSRRTYLLGTGRAIDEAAAEAEAHFETYKWYPQRSGRVDLVIEFARGTRRADDPIVRQEIAKLLSIQCVATWTNERFRQARALGHPPGAEGSLGKLANSRMARQAAHVHSLIAGARATLAGADDGHDGVLAEILVSVPAQSIAGGTDEIQKNILSEKVLGLPRDSLSQGSQSFRALRRLPNGAS